MFKSIFRGLGRLLLVALLGTGVYWGWNSYSDYLDVQQRALSPQGQLPALASPRAYRLRFQIDPGADSFNGDAEIDLVLEKNSDHVWLHGKNLNVKQVLVTQRDGHIIHATYQEMGHSGVARVDFGTTLAPQPLTLRFEYQASLMGKLAGIYRTTVDKKPYVFSQFEAIDARRAFPGFDEPRFKVPFKITLDVPRGNKALSNTPEIGTRTLASGWVRHEFAPTKPLPTYLLALAVGDFDIVQGPPVPANAYRSKPLPFRAIAIKGRGKDLGYVLAHNAAIVTALETYFGRAYPYAKLDIVAVPDFAAGAMENAGLITYRAQLLLLGDHPLISEQSRFYQVHAHELAHQWVGDLVTMPWWNDIWLNESFATWMERRIVAQIRPDLHIDRVAVASAHEVMDSDALISARSIREPITNNADIENAFDGITYQKGAAVLVMFERFLGKQKFRAGVRQYLQRFAFKTATADDFITSIQRATGRTDIGAAFRSFLNQSGVPEIKFNWSCADKTLRVQLQQLRYLPLGSDGDAHRTWNIPTCFAWRGADGAGNGERCTLLTKPQQRLIIPVARCPILLLPNAAAAGYYRWQVSTQDWTTLLQRMSLLSPSEQVSLMSNLDAAMHAGSVKPELLLTAVRAFSALGDLSSQTLPLPTMRYMAEYLTHGKERKQLARYLRMLYQPLLKQLGLDPNTPLDRRDPALATRLREQLVHLFALHLKEPILRDALVARARKYIGFDSDHKLHPTAINGDLASVALGVAVQQIGRPYFDALKQQLDDSSDGIVRRRILSGLAMANDPQLSEQVLDLVMSLDTRLNEKGLIVFGQAGQAEIRDNVYRWFKARFSLLKTILPDGYMAYSPMIAADFCDQKHYRDVEAFFSPLAAEVSGAERNLALTLERIKLCSTLRRSINNIKIPAAEKE